MDITNILLSIIALLLTICGFLLASWMQEQKKDSAELREKIDSLIVHPQQCLRQYADKEENAEAHRRILKDLGTHTIKVNDHETRIRILEKGQDHV